MWPLANRGKNAGDCLGGPERPANSVHAGSRIAAAATGSCTSVALNHNHLDCAQLATSGTSAAAPTTSTTVQDDFLRRLLQKRTTIDAKKLNSLQKATFLGNVPKSKALIAERNRDVNKLDSYHGFTALHVAAEFNKFEIAGLLVNPSSALDGKGMDVQMLKASFSVSSLKRCDPNIVNADGRTALALAVIHKNFDIVKLLLENKANTTIQDKAGCTAMHYAIALNDLPVVKLLLDNGANVEHLDHSRMSLLQHSILCDHVEIAELLAGLGAMINYCSASGGSSPLQMALDKGWNRLVKILLGKGADTTSLDAQSQQALERLEKEGSNSEFSATLRRKSTRKPLGRRKSVSVPLSVGGGQYLDSEDPRRPTEPGEGSNPTRKKSVRRRNTFDPSDFEGDATGQRRLSGLRPPSIEEEKLAYNEVKQ
ncbi:ankyrin repeat-containing domain protein [Zopfochytrium polystomum]|nr:ankyrin repeat-containing domain protein [Zopfochytrium polystomum]